MTKFGEISRDTQLHSTGMTEWRGCLLGAVSELQDGVSRTSSLL